MTTEALEPYTAHVLDSELEELRARLANVRRPDELANADTNGDT